MADYKHGAYGQVNSVGSRVADESASAIVYVGTAPVQQLQLATGETYPVNTPIVVNNIAEARKYFGYSDDWASYTLCEAMHVHFEVNGVGPLVLINVLDPTTHKGASEISVSKTATNGKIVIPNAGNIILDTINIADKTKGTDYAVSYNIDKKIVTLTQLVEGGLGTGAITIKYYEADPTAVTANTVIGTTDGMGLNTGLYAIKDVYTLTGQIPAFLAAPGFSSDPTVHSAMKNISQKINGHWDAYMFVDMPLTYNNTAVTLATAATVKTGAGYNAENETVYFPMAEGTDGKKYHLSVLAAANFQALLIDQDGIPYRSASNTDCPTIQNLYMGAAATSRVYDDSIINEYLNKNGIASATYSAGRWVIWGAHSADYDQENGNSVNVAETNRMMLYYISNDFQSRRNVDVDQPLTPNDIMSIASEEQARLDALLSIGALIYATVEVNASVEAMADIIKGDYSFAFNVTATPLAKSLTALVSWTDDGFTTYFETISSSTAED